MTLLRLSLLAALLAAATACTDKTPEKPPAAEAKKAAVVNATDPRWVSQADPHRRVAVVFVHGIFGDTLDTWSSGAGKPTFFTLLAGVPDVGAKLDMYAFGFTSNMLTAGSLDIRESANKLHEYLQFARVLDYPTVVFVAHSMGGLIVLRELINHREMMEKVPLVVLFATPQEGAQIAKIAGVVAKNPALAEMFPADRNGYLQALDEDWKRLPAHPHVSCGYEKLPTYDVEVIVPWSSATRFCDGAAVAIEGTDHISIVKPDRQDHGSIVLVANALNEYVLGKDVVARLETPDFVPEGDHFVFRLSDPLGKSSARLVNAGRVKLRYTVGQIADPSLYVWPDDTPREISGGNTQLMQLGLGFGANANEYPFVLQSDASPDQRVIVRVADLAAFRQKQRDFAEAVNKDVSAYLANPGNAAELASLQANDPRADEAFATVVADAVAKQAPELPKHAQWIVSADFLAAQNWPRVAATALRRAEALSPASAKTSSVQRLGGVVAAQSGQANVFASTTTPAVTKEELARDYAVRQTTLAPTASRVEVARQLKEVPAFKAYGWSLEGDVHSGTGNKEAAKAAYVESANLQKSPSINRRLETLTKAEPAAATKAVAKDSTSHVAVPDKSRSPVTSIDKFKSEVVRVPPP
jgi:pimeloyl-ACP methyl ester carboxylesterase